MAWTGYSLDSLVAELMIVWHPLTSQVVLHPSWSSDLCTCPGPLFGWGSDLRTGEARTPQLHVCMVSCGGISCCCDCNPFARILTCISQQVQYSLARLPGDYLSVHGVHCIYNQQRAGPLTILTAREVSRCIVVGTRRHMSPHV
jgi:hypothetical protein